MFSYTTASDISCAWLVFRNPRHWCGQTLSYAMWILLVRMGMYDTFGTRLSTDATSSGVGPDTHNKCFIASGHPSPRHSQPCNRTQATSNKCLDSRSLGGKFDNCWVEFWIQWICYWFDVIGLTYLMAQKRPFENMRRQKGETATDNLLPFARLSWKKNVNRAKCKKKKKKSRKRNFPSLQLRKCDRSNCKDKKRSRFSEGVSRQPNRKRWHTDASKAIKSSPFCSSEERIQRNLDFRVFCSSLYSL